MPVWSGWCRLCAREDADSSDPKLPECYLRVAKYLSIQVQKDKDLPSAICKNCSETLVNFDTYATQCEKVQYMFQTLLNSEHTIDGSVSSLRTFKNDYLQYYKEDKYIPICEIKVEKDPIEIGNLTQISSPESIKKLITKNWSESNSQLKNDFIIKEESERFADKDDSNDYDDRDYDSGSEEDDLPLATITEREPNKDHKKKDRKKLSRHSPKSKRKKKLKNKAKLKILENIFNEVVALKEENKSDEENFNNSANDYQIQISNTVETTKLKRTKLDDSFLSYECYICKENLKNWHALCLHFRDLHDCRAKVRCCCGKLLASRVSIARHCATHGKSKSFDCDQCSKRFPRESELRAHMITHLPKEELPFVCCKCARRFTSQQLLKHHEKKHIPVEERMIHPCEVCKSNFASKSSLLSHMRAIHQRLKPFVCDQCGRAFTTKGILEEHQVRHSDARPHICTICRKSFKTKQRLSIHLDTHNDTAYQCPHCPVVLNSRRTLRMHLFVHDDVSRYQCTFCEKAFKRAKDLKNHNNLHTGRRPYSCPWCSRTFANGSNCRAHKRRMHPHELLISDAKVALINKVLDPDMPINDKNGEVNSTPKIIHTIIKRKENLSNLPITKIPNFTLPSDISEKKDDNTLPINGDIPTISITVTNNEMSISGPTKQEKSSPVHIYESSLSPLNLNTTSASHKREEIRNDDKTSMNVDISPQALILKPSVDMPNGSEFNNASSSDLDQQIQSGFVLGDYKDIRVFSKNSQVYGGYNESVQNDFNIIVPPSFSNNPYNSHYTQSDNT